MLRRAIFENGYQWVLLIVIVLDTIYIFLFDIYFDLFMYKRHFTEENFGPKCFKFYQNFHYQSLLRPPTSSPKRVNAVKKFENL